MFDTPKKMSERQYAGAKERHMPDMTHAMQKLLMAKDTNGKYLLDEESMRTLNRNKTGRGKPPHESMGWREYRERLELEDAHRDSMSEWRKRATQRLDSLLERGFHDDPEPYLPPRTPPWQKDRKKWNYPEEEISLDEQKAVAYNSRSEMGNNNRFGRGW